MLCSSNTRFSWARRSTPGSLAAERTKVSNNFCLRTAYIQLLSQLNDRQLCDRPELITGFRVHHELSKVHK